MATQAVVTSHRRDLPRGISPGTGARGVKSPAEDHSPQPEHQRPQLLRQIELPEPEIMTVHEVADFLRVTTRTVTNLANDGTIPGIKCGKLWRFRRTSILALL